MGKIYLIDSNSLITPFEKYYPFDFAKRFWKQLETNIAKGNIVILDMVKSEITKKDDELSDWIGDLATTNFIDHRNIAIIEIYRQVLESIKNNDCYKDTALNDWASINSADPWLVATAKANNYTIVSFETPNKGLNASNPSKRPKIPDIASEFDVEVVDLFDMMRNLGFKM